MTAAFQVRKGAGAVLPPTASLPNPQRIATRALEQAERAIHARAMHGLYVARAEVTTIVRGAVWETILELSREMEQVAEARARRVSAAVGSPSACEALQALAAALRHQRRANAELIGVAMQAARELAP